MAGVTWKFGVGDAVSSVMVNANFADLVALSSNISSPNVMDGNIVSKHLISSVAVLPVPIERLRVLDGVESSLPPITNGGGGAGLVPLVGYNAPAGSRQKLFSLIEKDDVVIVSAFVNVVLNKPFNAAGVRPGPQADLWYLSVQKGLPGDPPVELPGAGGVDTCKRRFTGIDRWGYNALAGAGTGFGVIGGQLPSFTFHLNWMFQDDFSGIQDPNELTLYYEALGVAIPEVELTRAGLYVLVIKR